MFSQGALGLPEGTCGNDDAPVLLTTCGPGMARKNTLSRHSTRLKKGQSRRRQMTASEQSSLGPVDYEEPIPTFGYSTPRKAIGVFRSILGLQG